MQTMYHNDLHMNASSNSSNSKSDKKNLALHKFTAVIFSNKIFSKLKSRSEKRIGQITIMIKYLTNSRYNIILL